MIGKRAKTAIKVIAGVVIILLVLLVASYEVTALTWSKKQGTVRFMSEGFWDVNTGDISVFSEGGVATQSTPPSFQDYLSNLISMFGGKEARGASSSATDVYCKITNDASGIAVFDDMQSCKSGWLYDTGIITIAPAPTGNYTISLIIMPYNGDGSLIVYTASYRVVLDENECSVTFATSSADHAMANEGNPVEFPSTLT